MADTRAWLLDWPMHTLALAACEVIEIIDSPEMHITPFGPAWCRGLILWRDKLLPLALPENCLNDVSDTLGQLSVVVVAFQSARQQPLQYAAIPVIAKPSQFAISDGLDCDEPAQGPFKDQAVRACFQLGERVVLVPELEMLFGKTMRSAA